MRIDVWHDCYDAGRAILDAVIAAFDRSRFGLSGESRVTRMCRSDDFALQHGDGLWQFSVFFSLQAYLASGV